MNDYTPGEAVRKHCVECVGSPYEVKVCMGDQLLDGTVCHFFKNRLGTGRVSVKVIRRFCLHCMSGSFELVSRCTSPNCNVYKYRMGKNPNFKPTEERLAVLKKARKRQAYKRQNDKSRHITL